MRRIITVTITETWTWVWNPEPVPGTEQGGKAGERTINLRRRTTSESTVFAAGASLEDAAT